MPSFGVYYPDNWPHIDALNSGAKARNLKVATFARLLVEQGLGGAVEAPNPFSESVVVDLASVLLSPRMAAELKIYLGDVDQVAELRALLHERLENLRAKNVTEANRIAAETRSPYRPVDTTAPPAGSKLNQSKHA